MQGTFDGDQFLGSRVLNTPPFPCHITIIKQDLKLPLKFLCFLIYL